MENVPGAELNETAQNDAARKERESQAAVLYCSAGLAIVAALIWTLLGLAVTMGAAILFLAGMALLIWALFDSDHKLAGYIVMGCWFALGVFGLVIGQRNRPRVLPGPAEIIWHRSTEAGHDVEEHAFACDTPVT
ncbi:MAG TPA: hypothetical protein VMB47_15120, partial [Candidatus Aquilonibacter sp.]|nr:hypothetical protein [Candidatus Aquilonibacter sp.]